eukprot:7581002-Prorocentrum_lima.AAC.1
MCDAGADADADIPCDLCDMCDLCDLRMRMRTYLQISAVLSPRPFCAVVWGIVANKLILRWNSS